MGVNSNGTTLMDQGVFQNIGSVTWDTTAKTTGFTAVSGNGYFVNTTSGAITVTLPSSPSAGDVVGIKDYANTADTNAIVIGRNGSNIDGTATDYQINTEGLSALIVYVDATKGWLITNSSQASDISGPTYIVATGGTVTCCGDYKIHTFTGPGTFTVCSVGNPFGSNSVDYLVVAGGAGGAGANDNGVGGGGAGGFRESGGTASGCYTTSPLGACVSALPVSAQGYPITVGGGGTGGLDSASNGQPYGGVGGDGSNSVFSTITSAGGGGGANFNQPAGANDGGSGGGGGEGPVGPAIGAGNTPPVSPPQGNPGGAGNPGAGAGGGGGATTAGSAGTGPGGIGGPGGTGATTSITASSVSYAGGGGGGIFGTGPGGVGGTGGGGNGRSDSAGVQAGTTNTGGGGGGAGGTPTVSSGGAGGSGIVIIRYKYQ